MDFNRINSFDDQCTGCGACMSICPKKCIKFKRNDEGFDIPIIDKEVCIECGKCKTVCAAGNRKINGVSDDKQNAFAAITKDNKLWLESASGGAFSEICSAINKLANGRKVLFCGATINEKKVFHTCVDDIKDIEKFRKSKYVQSTIGDCFNIIEKNLKNDGYVVFSGTPCQVFGLREYLRKSYKNLFCIDLICHGVGSPGVFEKCLNKEEELYSKKIKEYNFRFKKPRFGSFERHTSHYVFDNGTTKNIKFDNYNKLFLNQICLRKSCGENCKFRNINRQGDFTIADFNEKYKAFPKLNDYRNYSTIVFNNEQGRRLIPYLQNNMNLYGCDLEHICKYNPLFCKTTKGNQRRDDFFKEYVEGKSIVDLVEKYGLVPAKGLSKLKQSVPYKIKRILFKISRGFNL